MGSSYGICPIRIKWDFLWVLNGILSIWDCLYPSGHTARGPPADIRRQGGKPLPPAVRRRQHINTAAKIPKFLPRLATSQLVKKDVDGLDIFVLIMLLVILRL